MKRTLTGHLALPEKTMFRALTTLVAGFVAIVMAWPTAAQIARAGLEALGK